MQKFIYFAKAQKKESSIEVEKQQKSKANILEFFLFAFFQTFLKSLIFIKLFVIWLQKVKSSW